MKAIDDGVVRSAIGKQKSNCWLRIGHECSEALNPLENCRALTT